MTLLIMLACLYAVAGTGRLPTSTSTPSGDRFTPANKKIFEARIGRINIKPAAKPLTLCANLAQFAPIMARGSDYGATDQQQQQRQWHGATRQPLASLLPLWKLRAIASTLGPFDGVTAWRGLLVPASFHRLNHRLCLLNPR